MLPNTGSLLGKTIFISGGSRGIGLAIALKCARDGANIVLAAKTVQPHPKLEGTIYTAAKEVEAAGGHCLPLQLDLRSEESVALAIEKTISRFGPKIDALVNNASAISLTNTEETSMKKFDLMHSINVRGTFMMSKYALPYLKASSTHAHILTLAPPLASLAPKWLNGKVAYAMAKYGMSMTVLGMAEEFKGQVAVNGLWPRTLISTAAMASFGGRSEIESLCRKVDIMADAAYALLRKNDPEMTGRFFVDEQVLREEGVRDFEAYRCVPGEGQLMADGFLEEKDMEGLLDGS